MFDDSYIKEINAAYWAEEEELRAGVHPTQIIPRVEQVLRDMGFDPDKVTFYDWIVPGPRVAVSYEAVFFGIFNYEENQFESTPESRLEEATKDFELNNRD